MDFPASSRRENNREAVKETAAERSVFDASLADRIKETCSLAEKYIESRVAELKASPEGELLPVAWLASNIRATTRAGDCHCKCALALLEKDKR